MFRKALVLLALGSALGLLFATVLGPRPAAGQEAPRELRATPAQPTRSAKEISRPIIGAAKKARPSVVQILAFVKWGGSFRSSGSGSGFVISPDGHVLTNHHVVQQGTAHIIEMEDGHRFHSVKVLGVDPRSDVAVLKIADLGGRELPVAALGDSDALEVGEIVVAIGAPYDYDSSVSMGIVSATGRTGFIRLPGASEEFIQTDAALNAGNSGGPLVNLDGQVVGINTLIRREGYGGNIGIGFAVPINLARSVAIALIEKGVARPGRLGIFYRPDKDRLLRQQLVELGIEAQGGIRVTGIEPGSPAAKAGIASGDIVTAVDGRPLADVNLLHARLAQAGPGGTVTLTVYRDKKGRDVSLELAEAEALTLGIEVETLTPERAATLDLAKTVTTGVVVTRVREGSVAAQADREARLLPGDVIIGARWRGMARYVRSKEEFDETMRELEARPPRIVEFFIVTSEGGPYSVPMLIPEGMG